MKLLVWNLFKRRSMAIAPASPSVSRTAAEFDEVAQPADRELLMAALSSLTEQMHEVINRNADGINQAAIRLRRETDILLSLGISDPVAGKAGRFAQMALELANAGRGVDLQAHPHDVSPGERAHLVAQAMTLMLRAETLLAAAKRKNLVNIEAALSRQERLVSGARAVLTST